MLVFLIALSCALIAAFVWRFLVFFRALGAGPVVAGLLPPPAASHVDGAPR